RKRAEPALRGFALMNDSDRGPGHVGRVRDSLIAGFRGGIDQVPRHLGDQGLPRRLDLGGLPALELDGFLVVEGDHLIHCLPKQTTEKLSLMAAPVAALNNSTVTDPTLATCAVAVSLNALLMLARQAKAVDENAVVKVSVRTPVETLPQLPPEML